MNVNVEEVFGGLRKIEFPKRSKWKRVCGEEHKGKFSGCVARIRTRVDSGCESEEEIVVLWVVKR